MIPLSLGSYYADDLVTLLQGDVTETLRQLPEESVHCVVTSPPFWNLRNYRVEGQIGLEPTLEEYIGKLVAVFREVRRVLRSDGVCWIECGDSYASQGGHSTPEGDGRANRIERQQMHGVKDIGLKPLDLANVPFRLALTLQADGWWHRSTLIWSRPNPMPESVHGTAFVRCRVKGLLNGSRALAAPSALPTTAGCCAVGPGVPLTSTAIS